MEVLADLPMIAFSHWPVLIVGMRKCVLQVESGLWALRQFAAINSQAPVMGATSIPFFGACGDDANICQPEADLREGTILAVNASCHLLVLVSVSAALYFMSAIHVDMNIY